MVMNRIPECSLPFKKRARFSNALLPNTERHHHRIDGNPMQHVADTSCPHEHLQAVADRMCMSRLELYISKPITKTDTCRNAHRYQMTRKEVDGVPALQTLKGRVASGGGGRIAVKVLDKHANEYDLFFSCMESNGNCRIVGPEWTRFLADSEIRVGEIMNVYGSCNQNGEFLFALFNCQ